MKITRKQAKQILESTNGKVFTVEFIKKDKSLRVMTARTGVKKHLFGGVSTIKDKEYLFGCFDMQTGGYRCINLDTLRKVKANGKEYEVVDA